MKNNKKNKPSIELKKPQVGQWFQIQKDKQTEVIKIKIKKNYIRLEKENQLV
jgi:hypothetical protein